MHPVNPVSDSSRRKTIVHPSESTFRYQISIRAGEIAELQIPMVISLQEAMLAVTPSHSNKKAITLSLMSRGSECGILRHFCLDNHTINIDLSEITSDSIITFDAINVSCGEDAAMRVEVVVRG